jgi:hypothetical protein
MVAATSWLWRLSMAETVSRVRSASAMPNGRRYHLLSRLDYQEGSRGSEDNSKL